MQPLHDLVNNLLSNPAQIGAQPRIGPVVKRQHNPEQSGRWCQVFKHFGVAEQISNLLAFNRFALQPLEHPFGEDFAGLIQPVERVQLGRAAISAALARRGLDAALLVFTPVEEVERCADFAGQTAGFMRVELG